MSMVLVFSALFGVVTLNTQWQDVPDETLVGTVLNLGSGPTVITNAAQSVVRAYDATNLAARIAAKYAKPASGIPMTDLKSDLRNLIYGKQDALVSGTNIKTINNQSILGAGNLVIQGGGGSGGVTTNAVRAIVNAEVRGTNTLVHIGDKVAWANVTNAPAFVARDANYAAVSNRAMIAITNHQSLAAYETSQHAAATYQPLIGDLATIRAGAAAGATAVQEEIDPTATAKAQAAIAAAGCVVTNAGGIIQLKGQYQPGIDFYVGGDLLVSWYRDYVFASGNMYYCPWSSAYGTDAAHDLALRSQIYVEKNDNSFGVLPLLQYGGKDAAGFWFSAINPLWAYYDTQLSKPLLKWGDDIVALESQIPTSATVEGWGFAKTSAIPTAYLASASATATSITVTPNAGAAVSLAVEYEYALGEATSQIYIAPQSGQIVSVDVLYPSDGLGIVLPTVAAGKSCDFILRVDASAGATQIGSISNLQGATVDFLGDALTETGKIAQGVTYIYFTRTSATSWMATARKVDAVYPSGN